MNGPLQRPSTHCKHSILCGLLEKEKQQEHCPLQEGCKENQPVNIQVSPAKPHGITLLSNTTVRERVR